MKQKLLTEFKEKLLYIENSSHGIKPRAMQSIELSRRVLRLLRRDVISYGFKSTQHEIDFFKYTKIIPQKELIYFLKVINFEQELPKSDKESQRQLIEFKLQRFNRFFLRHIDFGQYLELENTHFDEHYFTRKHNSDTRLAISKLYNEDLLFNTPKSTLLAEFKACSAFVGYLQKRLFHIENPTLVKDPKENTKLIWPFGFSAFVELISLLSASGLHTKNNITIIDLARKFQEIIDIEMKGFYNTRNENATRSKGPTQFTDAMLIAYLNELSKKDELNPNDQ
ncbi:RteC domain-containing protein [Formosa sp. L2A11]|uniref:RteC domain-containing protein n=1 Tax=Formosa sp. L2A11 TaxID=2686363 RepID=UPI00131D0AC6|nr:RteC domain-containing protein [Formosa sp. L2A11]